MKHALVASAAASATPAVLEAFSLERTPFGKLVLTKAQGQRFEGVVPVRAFPIQAPEEGVSVLDTDGHEVAWVPNLADLSPHSQDLLRQALALREFMPVVARIVSVSGFSTPCTWRVETDRGACEFVLRGDEDIRRVGTELGLLIADAHGIHYLVRDQLALDAHSKKILDRFL
ncbi:MAG: DUF1854 domain-containing protein [Betaproteobacteria bacterium]